MHATEAERTKKRALIGSGLALVATVGAWFFFNSATNRGIARLNHIDSVFAVCNAEYVLARTRSDTARIDTRPLSAAIDSGKEGAPRRCGDLRRPDDALAAQDSARRTKAKGGLMPTRDGR